MKQSSSTKSASSNPVPAPPPSDIEAEQATLSSMMIDRKAIFAAQEMLAEGDYYRPTHGLIFRAIVAINQRDEPVDTITLKDELIRMGKLEEVGGVEYLMAIMSQLPSAARIEHYAKIVKDKAVSRRILIIAYEMNSIAHGNLVAEEAIDRATQHMIILRQSTGGRDLMWMREALTDAWDALGERMASGGGIPTLRFGMHNLDNQTIGINPGFTVIGARPSHGKTSLIFEIIRASIPAGPFLVFSIETGARSLANRLIAAEAAVDLRNIRRGEMGDDELSRVSGAINDLYDLPVLLKIGEVSIGALVATTQMAILEHGIKAVFVDYAQLIDCKAGTEYERCTYISQSLKTLSININLPVIAAVQLNREPERRRKGSGEVSKPRMSDIRGSGQFEQDADLGILIHNPKAKGATEPVEAEIMIEKQKDGPTGTASCMWIPHLLRFYETEDRQEQEVPHWAR